MREREKGLDNTERERERESESETRARAEEKGLKEDTDLSDIKL